MPESLTDPPSLKPRTVISSPGGSSPRARSAAVAATESLEPADAPEQASEEVGAVAAALASGTAVSLFSSACFHLIIWGLAFVVCQLLGLDWKQLIDSNKSSIQASLGDEDVFDDAARFELVGEVGLELEIPANNSLVQIAQQLGTADQAWLSSSTGDAWSNLPKGDGSAEEGAGSGVLLRVPASGLAVTKGSFTAFTIPAQPIPLKPYQIVIEVRLTDNVRKYRVSDLSGEVRGSDHYVQKLPFDARAPLASGYPAEDKKIKPLTMSTVLDVVNNRVQIIIRVPGAARLVRDEIRVRSRKLREEQELTLIFGKPVEETPERKPPGNKDAD